MVTIARRFHCWFVFFLFFLFFLFFWRRPPISDAVSWVPYRRDRRVRCAALVFFVLFLFLFLFSNLFFSSFPSLPPPLGFIFILFYFWVPSFYVENLKKTKKERKKEKSIKKKATTAFSPLSVSGRRTLFFFFILFLFFFSFFFHFFSFAFFFSFGHLPRFVSLASSFL